MRQPTIKSFYGHAFWSWLAYGFMLFAIATEAHAAVPTSATAVTRPNIVLIVADDLGWNGVGYHDGFVKTPNVDRIAREGVQLDRFYVSPMCSPTRAGLMTGRYAMSLGMGRTVVRPWARYGISPTERTLPEALQDAGYARRGAFGKWHLGHLESQWHPLSQGFTTFVGCYNGAVDYWTRDREGEIDWHVDGEPRQSKGYTTDLIADAACEFIEESAGEGPFFCYVPFTAPHDPLQAPKAYLDKYAHLDGKPNDGQPGEKQRLAALIDAMDVGIGRILASLDEAGVADDTIVWFLSDNGGIGKIRGNNAPLRGAKLTVYEGGVRVPAAIRWPGHIDGGRTVADPIMNIDVMPTLLALVDAKEVPANAKSYDGIDVSAALTAGHSKGRSASAPRPRDLYFYHGQDGLDSEQQAVTNPEGWKLIVRGPDLRTGVDGGGKREIELFNVFDDPSETTDHASEKPELVADLTAKLVAFRQSEPEDAMQLTPQPRDFKPPTNWRNAPSQKPKGRPVNAVPVTKAETAGDANLAGARPNIVVILADDLGFSDLGCYGSEIETPNIDRLAERGVRFRQFYNNGRCCPSRASILTGRYPHQVGVGAMIDGYATWIRNAADRASYDDHLSHDAPTVAELLRDSGYRTMMSGKWHLGSRRAEWPAKRGFDRSFALIPGAMNYWGGESSGPRAPMALDDKKFTPPHDGFFATDAFTDRAIEFIDQSHTETPDQPFFLYLAYNAPHWPLHAPAEDIERYSGRYDGGWQQTRLTREKRMHELGVTADNVEMAPLDRGKQPPWDELDPEQRREWARRMEIFAAQVTRMDENIGRLLDELEELGVADDTLVMFLSDNGGAPEDPHRGRPAARLGLRDSFWGYDRPWASVSNTPWRNHKLTSYEGGISSPAIVSWPAAVPAAAHGKFVDGPAHLIDLPPTFLHLAGSEPTGDEKQPNVDASTTDEQSPRFEGRNITEMLRGQSAPADRTLCWEHEGNRAIRKGNWKLVELAATPGWELYDLAADRAEQHNLAAERPEIVRELADEYDRWATRCDVVPWPEITAARPPAGAQ